jgi:catechol 2,3-dioxygenase-like lactoylglutathione lyase family enzyme
MGDAMTTEDMPGIDRRRLMTSTGAAMSLLTLATMAASGTTAAEPHAATSDKMQPDATNPMAAKAAIYTIVTPDLEAGTKFYRDVLGHDVVDHGKLEGKVPALAGASGRAYALLHHKEAAGLGVIRLLQAPDGAKANRPQPDASIIDAGLVAIECHVRDPDEAFKLVGAAGGKAVSAPQYYYFGASQLPTDSSTSFSAFGPAGEQIVFNCANVPDALNQRLTPDYPGVVGPFFQYNVMTRDRWPTLRLMGKAFGLKTSRDRLAEQPNIATMIGAPDKTALRFIDVGDHSGMQLWEYRMRAPTATPPWPTGLDKTGLAMVTIMVDKIAAVKTKLKESGIAVLAEGSLPTPEGKGHEGLYIRGAEGELIEVIGRG